jgi:hypothetical protein
MGIDSAWSMIPLHHSPKRRPRIPAFVFKQEFTTTQREVAVLCNQSALWSVTTGLIVIIVVAAIINRNSVIAIIRLISTVAPRTIIVKNLALTILAAVSTAVSFYAANT